MDFLVNFIPLYFHWTHNSITVAKTKLVAPYTMINHIKPSIEMLSIVLHSMIIETFNQTHD